VWPLHAAAVQTVAIWITIIKKIAPVRQFLTRTVYLPPMTALELLANLFKMRDTFQFPAVA
jgi:hypothetical protein